MDRDQHSPIFSTSSDFTRLDDGSNHHQPLEGVRFKGQRPGSGQSVSSAEVQRPGSGQSISSAEVQRPGSGQSISSAEVQRPGSGKCKSSAEAQMLDSGKRSTATSEETKAFTTSGYIRSYSVAELDEIIASSYNRILSLENQGESLDERLKYFPKQVSNLSNVPTQAQTLNANFSDHITVNDPAEIQRLMNAKAERKKRKVEKRARAARKVEEARMKEQKRVEADKMVAEVSKHRSMFNRNKQALPAIASKLEEEKISTGGKRNASMLVRPSQSLPENNVIDIIGRHEAQVRTTTFIRDLSLSRMNAYAELMQPFKTNTALEIIERHEEEVGTSYAVNNPNVNNGSTDMSSNARSRCSSRVSRRGAA